MSQQPSTCPYCGQTSVTTVPYEETILFRGIPVHQSGTMEHCSNPRCIEPDRFTYEQMSELDRQIKEQVAAWKQQHQEQQQSALQQTRTQPQKSPSQGKPGSITLGIAEGEFEVGDIDAANNDIADMFYRDNAAL